MCMARLGIVRRSFARFTSCIRTPSSVRMPSLPATDRGLSSQRLSMVPPYTSVLSFV